MIDNLLTDLFKKVEGQGILSTPQASNMNKPVAGPVNVCDPNDPNYLECVQRNYQGGEGRGPSIDYESFAAKPSSSFGLNLGDMFSSFSQPQTQTQESSMFNPLGFSNQTRLAGLAFGPVGILGSLAVEKYRAGQEAKAAAEAKAAEAARAKQEQINRNKQYFSGGDGGGRGNIGSDGADYSGSAQTGAKGGFGYGL
jgi:hypothetical protein